MTNIAQIFRAEISRVTPKEVGQEIEGPRKSTNLRAWSLPRRRLRDASAPGTMHAIVPSSVGQLRTTASWSHEV